MTGREWMAGALCSQIGGDWWFPARNQWDAHRTAVRICGMCPVAAECLAWSQQHRIEFGIWGGVNAEQRMRMRDASRRRDTCGRGHPMSGANLQVNPDGTSRRCRTCKARADAERARRRERTG